MVWLKKNKRIKTRKVKISSYFRSVHTRYIFGFQEPPMFWGHFRPEKNLDGVFNWTMTYRLDSELYFPYVSFKYHK